MKTLYKYLEDIASTPGNTIGMGNPMVPTETQPGTEPICAKCKKEKQKKKTKNLYKESILDDEEDLISSAPTILVDRFKEMNDIHDDVIIEYKDGVLEFKTALARNKSSRKIFTAPLVGFKECFPDIKKLICPGLLAIKDATDWPSVVVCDEIYLSEAKLENIDLYASKVRVHECYGYKSNFKNVGIYKKTNDLSLKFYNNDNSFCKEIKSDATEIYFYSSMLFDGVDKESAALLKDLDNILEPGYTVEYTDKQKPGGQIFKPTKFKQIKSKINQPRRYRLLHEYKDDWFEIKDKFNPVKDIDLLKGFLKPKAITLADNNISVRMYNVNNVWTFRIEKRS